MRILVADPVSESGLALLQALPEARVEAKTGLAPAELCAQLGHYDVLVVRSQTKVTADVLRAGERLKIVARAGQGYDNIDVKAATELGIAVMNTPAKNSSAAAEHAVAMMFALSRDIPQAYLEMRGGKWERAKHVGVELAGKTLALLGLGNVGRQVAWRAQGLKMQVVAFDPFVSDEAMKQIGIRKVELDEALAAGDYVSLHLVLNADTQGFIGRGAIAKMKAGARLINCARGGLVDDAALIEALDGGKLAGAALDVFVEEPLPKGHALAAHPKIVVTPHLGASTEEAQEEVMKALAEQLRAFIEDGAIVNGINVPNASRELLLALGAYLDLAEKLGRFLSQVRADAATELHVACSGDLLKHDVTPVTTAALVGFMKGFCSDSLNFVNAPFKAKERGIRVVESRDDAPTGFQGLVRVTAKFGQATHSIAGSVFGRDGQRIVAIDDFDLEAEPRGHLLLIENEDRPGILGAWASTLGQGGVNIARVHLGRSEKQRLALALVNVDSKVAPETIAALEKLPHVRSVRSVELS